MSNEQISFADTFSSPEYKIDKPIRLIELFGGIGSQAKALKNIGANFEHYRLIEFDKYPVASYNAVHGTNFTTMDITKTHADDLAIVNTNDFCYIMTYSFPCQDLSLAGKQKGMTKGSGTRSGLLWEVERLLNECDELPQILLMENVKQVIGKKNKPDFDNWCEFLESKGYSNHYKVLNAKDYGIPQNRERCFMVSILGNYTYKFPDAIPLELRLKDLLDQSVDEKFYLTESTMKTYMRDFGSKVKLQSGDGICNTLVSAMGGGGGNVPIIETDFIPVKNATKKGYLEAREGDYVNLQFPNSETRRGRVGDQISQTLLCNDSNGVVVCEPVNPMPDRTARTIKSQYAKNSVANFKRDDTMGATGVIRIKVIGNYSPSNHHASRIVSSDGIAPTVTESHGTVTATNVDLRIRKFTPKECWRLMGFDDDDVDRASKVNSNSQLYKQAGNSIVVNVLMAIFNNLLKEEKDVEKTEEIKVVSYTTNKMIDLAMLEEKEPELFDELVRDYPVESGTKITYNVV